MSTLSINTLEKISSIAVNLTTNLGGASLRVRSSRRAVAILNEKTNGYAVGGCVQSVQDTEPIKAIGTAIKIYGDLLDPKNGKGYIFGTWIDEETGVTHVDISELVEDYTEAVKLAKERKEIAIWDFKASKEVRI